MLMRITVTGVYPVPDDRDERLRIYGTADPGEMAAVDMRNPVEEMFSFCQWTAMSIEPQEGET